MKRYATSYVNFFENVAKTNIIEAEDEIKAMKKAIVINNPDDKHIKEWIDIMNEVTLEDFKEEITQCDMSVDAVEIY